MTEASNGRYGGQSKPRFWSFAKRKLMNPSEALDNLRRNGPLIAPSMLKCDFGNLHREIALLESAGADLLHWDVMDGHFVPNLTYGPVLIERLREMTPLPFDAHLMIAEPERYLDQFLKAGCQVVTIHIEAAPEPVRLLSRIRGAGRWAGLALNPGTPVDRIAPYLDDCDLILVMSVEPGFGGQQFMAPTLDKIAHLAGRVDSRTRLAVDGGIGRATIARAAEAGATMFVAGSAVFETGDYGQAIGDLRQLARRPAASLSDSISS